MNSKPVVLTFLDYYLPGFKSGGPLRTVSNMVAQIGQTIDFRIITRDRDATDTQPYPEIEPDAWNPVGKACVYYASPGRLSLGALRSLVETARPDVLYLNSFFSTLTIKCLALRRIRALPPVPVVLAPRGEFSPGALALKRRKKRLYIATAKRLGLYDNVLWQASSPVEQGDIRSVFGDQVQIHVAPDVPAVLPGHNTEPRKKSAGDARFIFLSRISPKKNLHRLLSMLSNLSGKVTLSVVGPVGDQTYWHECKQIMNQLSASIHVIIVGAVPHEQVLELLSSHHFFVLPTLGENFGHAILESLAVGTPVIISDQTPWRNLVEESAGWDLPLEKGDIWQDTLQACIDMDDNEYKSLSVSAAHFAHRWLTSSEIIEANLQMFNQALHSMRS